MSALTKDTAQVAKDVNKKMLIKTQKLCKMRSLRSLSVENQP